MKSLGSSSKFRLISLVLTFPRDSYRPCVLAAATADPVDIAANSTIFLVCLGATATAAVVTELYPPPAADAAATDDLDYYNSDFHGQEIALDEPHSREEVQRPAPPPARWDGEQPERATPGDRAQDVSHHGRSEQQQRGGKHSEGAQQRQEVPQGVADEGS